MARQEIVLYKDDIDGSEKDVRAVTFEFDGASYTIDLGAANYTKLKKVLGRYMDAGTKVSGRARTTGRGRSARRSTAASQKEFNARVREWAAANGHNVKPRGRIPEGTLDAFHKAGSK